jgi:hypothetical protein
LLCCICRQVYDTVLLKQKKQTVLDITGFFFPHEYSGEGRGAQHQCRHLSTNAEKEAPRPSPEYSCGKTNPLYSIQANSFVSIIMYLICTIIVLLKKIYGMAYIFTLLMYRKPNKTTISKNKTTNFYRSTSFRFSFIFRYFKVFQVSQIFTCGLSDLLLLAVGSLVVFVLRE